jgi:hypothetical protein
MAGTLWALRSKIIGTEYSVVAAVAGCATCIELTSSK